MNLLWIRVFRLGDWLFAFLGDVYLVTTREGANEATDTVTGCIADMAGVQTHLGAHPEAWDQER